MFSRPTFLAAILGLTLAACAPKAEKKPADEEKPPEEVTKPSIIGSIRTVSQRGNFVLIQKLGPGKLPSTGTYQTLANDGSSASLRPSGERVRNLFAADILHGTPNPGDAVLHHPGQKPQAPKPSPEATTETRPEPEPSSP